jgi:hypothetical protein
MQTIAKQQEALTAMTGRNVQLLLEVEQLRVQNADFLSLIRELRLALEGQSPESHH